MKIKYCFLLALMTIIYLKVSAQVKFGIKAGYNLASIPVSPDNYYTPHNLSAFNAGLMASIPIANHLSLQPEIVYSEQGIKITNHSYMGDQQLKFYYNYLNIPGLIKYQHSSGFFAETGPQLGILLNVKFVYGDEWQSNNRDGIWPLDLGWVFGLGYKIPKINLGLDIRYNLGLSNINKYAEPGSGSPNRVLQMGLFYFFK